MEEIKYYKVKLKKEGLNWLTMINYDKNNDFWYTLEKRAMLFSSVLFQNKNRLTDFLSDKTYEKILIDNIENIDLKFVIDKL